MARTSLCAARLILCAVCVLLPVLFDPRMPVLPALRFLLSYGCCLNRIRCCMAATASAYGCAAVFVCCAAGGLWRRVSCGMVWRRECEDALRRCGSLPCFCTLSSFFALFLTFSFLLSHVLFFRRRPLRSPLRQPCFLPFLSPHSSFHRIPFRPLIPLSLRAFPGGRLSSVDLLISGGIYYII